MKLLLYYVHIRLVTKELELFNSDPTLPIYSRNTTGYDVMELTKILLKDPPAQKYICTSRPRGVSENATFLIDVDVVCYEDLKTDDMGSWRTKGNHIILLHKIIRVMVSESLGLLRYIQPLCIIILIIQLTGTKSTYFKLKDGRVEVIDNKQKTTSRCFCLIR